MSAIPTGDDAVSTYGSKFDELVETWRTIEGRHDRLHPDRGRCGGVGGCSMMAAAVDLEHEMIEALADWRVRPRPAAKS
jgi:hypothetical protein